MEARGGRYLSDLGYGFDSDEECYECGGAGCEECGGGCDECGGYGCPECNSEFEEEITRCHGTTQRGTRCQITSQDAVYSDQRRFRDAAARLGYSNYCEFHKDQEYEEHVCYECDGDGCPECCSECDGVGCEECLGEDEMSAVPAAPSTDEVELVGSRTREERDAEARTHAIDVEAESAKAAKTAPKSASCNGNQEQREMLFLPSVMLYMVIARAGA